MADDGDLHLIAGHLAMLESIVVEDLDVVAAIVVDLVLEKVEEVVVNGVVAGVGLGAKDYEDTLKSR